MPNRFQGSLVLLTCWLLNQLWEAGTRPNRATGSEVNAKHRRTSTTKPAIETGYALRLGRACVGIWWAGGGRE